MEHWRYNARFASIRNKVYPPNTPNHEYKPSSTPCPGEGYLSDFKWGMQSKESYPLVP